MPKSASPVRLEANLMQAAAIKGERDHRSAAEQIEYWASIGRSVADTIDPDKLLAVSAGLAKLKVEPVQSPAVDVDSVFDALEMDRESGKLQASIRSPANANLNIMRYQASTEFPGQLEQIDPNGKSIVGQFSNGKFKPLIS